MKTCEINIRDPFVLLHDGVYYLYGTRSATCWGPADGFDCYYGTDLENWEGPIEIFHRPEGFFADQAYWAPECYFWNGKFYLITTLGADGRKKAVYTLVSDKPTGPFEFLAGPLTPAEWTCIDGSLYFEDGTPYLLFSHSFEDGQEADISIIQLDETLTKAVSAPETLFPATAAGWIKPVPFMKGGPDGNGDIYFTDGPCAMKMPSGKLYLSWSGWSVAGYAVGIAVSRTGSVKGPYMQLVTPLYPENGGHGMLFRANDGRLLFTLHSPNDKYAERPHFYEVKEENGTLILV